MHINERAVFRHTHIWLYTVYSPLQKNSSLTLEFF
jgi:hypothetical protein